MASASPARRRLAAAATVAFGTAAAIGLLAGPMAHAAPRRDVCMAEDGFFAMMGVGVLFGSLATTLMVLIFSIVRRSRRIEPDHDSFDGQR